MILIRRIRCYFVISCMALVVVATTSGTYAQKIDKDKTVDTEPGWVAGVRDEMGWMQENLGLTNEQYDRTHEICMRYGRQADSVSRLADVRLRDKAKEKCRKNKDEEIKKVLSTSQYQLYADRKPHKSASKSPFGHSY